MGGFGGWIVFILKNRGTTTLNWSLLCWLQVKICKSVYYSYKPTAPNRAEWDIGHCVCKKDQLLAAKEEESTNAADVAAAIKRTAAQHIIINMGM